MINRQWPFVYMKVGDSELICGEDDVTRASLRLTGLRQTRPDMFFAVKYHGINEMLVTKVATPAEAIRERRPCTANIRTRTNWPFRFMEPGDKITFDVTFIPDRITPIGDYARVYGRSKGWKMQVRTRRQSSGQRLTMVTRLS